MRTSLMCLIDYFNYLYIYNFDDIKIIFNIYYDVQLL